MTQVVLVDEQDNVIGLKEKFEAHKNPVPLHRAISVIIYNSRGQMLLQKRAGSKPTWPLYWSNTCCTHPLPDESYIDCATRRLPEEMGIDTTLEERLRVIYDFKYDQSWGEHEFDVVFVGKYDGAIKMNPEEADDYKWVDVDELKKDIKINEDQYTPWFKLILERL